MKLRNEEEYQKKKEMIMEKCAMPKTVYMEQVSRHLEKPVGLRQQASIPILRI